MLCKKSLVLFFCSWFCTFFGANATTYVGQNIDQNTTWTKANSPYVVTTDLLVEKDITLTIQAGTKIFFSKETQIIVSGNLVAKGSKNQKIYFVGLNGSDWNGFLFTKECNDYTPDTKEGVCFIYCSFKGTGNAPTHLIRSKGCNINLVNCTIEHCYTAIQTERQAEIWVKKSCFKHCNRVLNVRNTSLATVVQNKMTSCNSIMLGGTTTFKNNTLKKFTGNGRHSGLVVWMLGGGIVDISHNQFIKFEDYAIKLHKMNKRSSFLVANNDFKHNKTNLKLSCKYYNQGTSLVENNNFYNHKKYHIKLFEPCADEATEVLKIGSNYWGKLSEEEIKTAVFDKHQNENISAEIQLEAFPKKIIH
ncbi:MULTISPECIES: hypothetical protein [unclassified Aureispira]|uniref:hypothetical protein n=1 Tax=unclassified Aureispira TaxID=2649989 RepID=UPI0006963736|nr:MULTISPECIES: hypothetical protein [unclassified Aureispira]WMX13909.1 hypothetical protein QP953_23940 [Aureispira sp. CCB-E]